MRFYVHSRTRARACVCVRACVSLCVLITYGLIPHSPADSPEPPIQWHTVHPQTIINSLFPRTIVHWNSLLLEVVTLTTVD